MVLTNGLMLVYNDATDKRSFSSPSLTDWILPLSDSADGFSSRLLDNLTVKTEISRCLNIVIKLQNDDIYFLFPRVSTGNSR